MELATLGETFATEIPAILKATHDADSDQASKPENEALSVIISRAAEPPVIAALSCILISPIEDGDFTSLEMHQLILYSIVSKLSLEQLKPYQPAIRELMEFDISSYKSRSGHYAQTMHLINNAKLLDRFIQDPEDVWVPENKFDYISYRTLWERVQTAEQMRPYMYGLFNWQVDPCHPPFKPCREQLARFPEVSAAVAAEIMSLAVNDVEHQHWLIDFVSEYVPVGEAWLAMRAPVEQMVRTLETKSKEERENNGEDDYLDEGKKWLATLRKWEISN
jgi:hypothetical protein